MGVDEHVNKEVATVILIVIQMYNSMYEVCCSQSHVNRQKSLKEYIFFHGAVQRFQWYSL